MQTRALLSRAIIASVLTALTLMHTSTALSDAPPTPTQTRAIATTPAASAKDALDVARFTADGQLVKPADLAQWVFLGTSLGMGYNQARFDPASPGQFQVVLMEPNAYRYFMEHGQYAPGSMFLLSFYGSDQRRSINRVGYVQANLSSFEIHLVDARKAPEEGRVFYVFDAQDAMGSALPKGSECVRCHARHGAFDGTFAQFYPAIRDRIPREALERALNDHDIR
jgi:Cytochrome P460